MLGQLFSSSSSKLNFVLDFLASASSWVVSSCLSCFPALTILLNSSSNFFSPFVNHSFRFPSISSIFFTKSSILSGGFIPICEKFCIISNLKLSRLDSWLSLDSSDFSCFGACFFFLSFFFFLPASLSSPITRISSSSLSFLFFMKEIFPSTSCFFISSANLAASSFLEWSFLDLNCFLLFIC